MSFLSSLAQTLITAYGTDLSRVTVVFPNKRASLFLNEELTHLYDKPLWSPAYITISDLFRSMSSLEVADPIKLICDLHKSYVKCTGIEESLDHFYGWGQILLSDFDDVDKHLAPADKVFANLRNIHEYDDVSYLSQQQKDIIRKFFSNFNDSHNSELKQRFLSFWSHIYDIYLDFNARLASQGLAYEGSLYRQVIEKSLKIEVNAFLNRQYVFAGFNLLLPVEQALIQHFEAEDKACLIQDTDEETPKEISIISAPTDNIQARYVPTWLKENNRIEAGSKTAIVLADESLLQTVIHAIPPEVTKLNITTGYPLSQTTAATRVAPQDVLIPRGGQSLPLRKHSARGGTTSQDVFERKTLTPDSPLELEALYRLELILNRLQTLIDSGDLQVSDATLRRLLTQIIASTTIPFHGEPIEGIQIMGVLETRNLDFDHVLLLSCNEGNLPKGINDTSFIPYSIRKAYNLTTADHKVDIYHNYFRRLLQRASDVTILYNNSTNDGKTGEMSQFMLQLLVESPHPITLKTLQAGQQPSWSQPLPVNKSPELIEVLRQRFSEKPLSPSALSLYLRCPLQFFYRYVAGLDEYKEEDPMDSRLFGTIFHKAAQLLYSTDFSGNNLSFENVLARRSSSCGMFSERKVIPSVCRAVDEAIKLELFHIEDPMAPMPPLNGLQLINREVIIKYLHQLLEVDRQLAPFTILALETPLSSECGQILPFENVLARRASSCGMFSERKNLSTVKVGGVVDRIDLISLPDGTERIRVVDYKTSSTRLKPLPDVAAIFDPANIKYHSDYYLQAILYACLVEEKASLYQKEERTSLSKNIPHEEERRARTFLKGMSISSSSERNNTVGKITIRPCLLFIQHAGTDNYDPTLILGKAPITDVTEIKDEFMHHLTNLITEIFDSDTPFLPTEERTRCKSCPFHALCQS